jgi:uncharacterized phage protein (TIGR02218 family)
MKTVSAALQAHFGQAVTTLAVLWKVTRQDGTVMGFTSLDQNINYLGVTYLASTGFLPNANETKSDMSVDNTEVSGFLDSVNIKEADIRNGLYDYATIEQRIVNYMDFTQGDVIIRRGIIGTIKMVNGLFTAEIRGLTQYLSTMVGSLFGPACRAELYSDQSNTIDPGTKYLCHVKEADYQQTGSVSSAPNALSIIPNAGLVQKGSATPANPAPAGWFTDGTITFTSGVNNGFSFEIKTWDTTTIGLFLPMPAPPAPGDTFTIEPGCDKTPTATGCLKFQGYSSDGLQTIVATTNIANFRGEPFIPGTDLILNYPDAK